MMYSEFVALSGQEITCKQYSEIIEPMYMALPDMSKQDFVVFIAPSCRALVKAAKREARRNQKTVFVGDGTKTPNGCYYLGHYYKLVDVDFDIRTGKKVYTIRQLDDDEEIDGGWDPWLNSSIDIRTTDEMAVIREVA